METKNNQIKNETKEIFLKAQITNQSNTLTLNNNFKTIYMYIPNKKKVKCLFHFFLDIYINKIK